MLGQEKNEPIRIYGLNETNTKLAIIKRVETQRVMHTPLLGSEINM